jgi:hypothetical protein
LEQNLYCAAGFEDRSASTAEAATAADADTLAASSASCKNKTNRRIFCKRMDLSK